MKKPFFLSFLLIGFFVTAQPVISSANSETISLNKLLRKLEKTFEIRFSFNSALVKDINVTEPDKSEGLEAIVANIQKKSGLLFEKINERYYVLRKKNQRGRLTLCGFLIDADTRLPLAQATVVNATQKRGVLSDETGYFELFLAAPTDTLDMRFLGYRSLQRQGAILKSQTCDTLFMHSNNVELSEVIIGDYLTSGVDKRQNGAIKIIPKKLGILPGLIEPDVLQSAQLLPGVQSPTETASGIYMRGGTPDQNLVLWDGIKMYHTGHFFGLISAFNPYITEDVTLYRSGSPARYGDRISGVIDIRSENNLSDSLSGGFGFNLTHADAWLKLPLSKNFGLVVSGRRSYTDIIETTTYNQFSERVFQNTTVLETEDQQAFNEDISETNNRFYFADYTVKAIFRPSVHDKITASHLYTRNSLDYAVEIEDFLQNSSDRLTIENLGARLYWKRQWHDKLQQQASIYYSAYDLDYKGSDVFDDSFTEVLVKRNDINETGASLEFNWLPHEKHRVDMGYQFTNTRVSYELSFLSDLDEDDESENSDDLKNKTHALFTEYRFTDSNFTAVAGLRWHHFSELERSFLEPRLFLEWGFTDFWKMRLTAESKNQAISQLIEFETLDFGLENQVWVLADDEFLPPLKSTQFSAGFNYSQKGWNIDFEGYFKDVNGLTSLTRGFTPVTEEFSVGESRVLGFDLLIKKKIGGYRNWVSYSLTKNNFTFEELNDGESFPGNFDIRHHLIWSHAYHYKNWQFSLGWRYHSGVPFTPVVGLRSGNNGGNNIDYGAVNSRRLPAYHRLDFSATWGFWFSKQQKLKGKLGFSLLNLYNRENLLSRYYEIRRDFNGPIPDRDRLRQVDKFSLGITPNLVFRVRF